MRSAIAGLFALSMIAAGCGTVGSDRYVRAYAAGDRAYTAGRFGEAADAYEQAAATADRARDEEEALYAAADAHLRADDVDGALRGFDALAAARPPGERSIRAAYRAARLRLARGETRRAYDELASILRLAPEHGVTRRALEQVVAHVESTEGHAAAIAWEEALFSAVASTRLGEEIAYDVATRYEAGGDDARALTGFLACAERYPYPKGALWDDALWHASLLHERRGDFHAAIEVLQRMLAVREKSYFNGSYDRPRMPRAQLRIGELQRDRLEDHASARASFHRLYADFPRSIFRPQALFAEADLAKRDGDDAAACKLATVILDEFADSRFARRADDVCPAVAPRAADLRKKREQPMN